MFGLALLLLHNEEESRDAVSEVFATLMEGGKMPDAQHEGQYLMACVRNRCLKIIRHRHVKERVSRLLRDSADIHPDKEIQLCRDIFHFAHDHLPPLTFQILSLRYQDGMRYQDVAKQLNISEVTVFRHVSEALRIIKQQFSTPEKR